jgi:hypothetical protein
MRVGLILFAAPYTVDPATFARKAEEVGLEQLAEKSVAQVS